MSTAVAKQPDNYAYLMTPVFTRTRTKSCEIEAITVLKTYKRYGQITENDLKDLTKEIKAAPHDDAIANIMTKLRKRVYG